MRMHAAGRSLTCASYLCARQVKGRIKDLEKVTSLPSFLQENRGFKSQELSEQADYETSDDVTDQPARHWLINDLVLFIDNEDWPRIPRKLFEVSTTTVVSHARPASRQYMG